MSKERLLFAAVSKTGEVLPSSVSAFKSVAEQAAGKRSNYVVLPIGYIPIKVRSSKFRAIRKKELDEMTEVRPVKRSRKNMHPATDARIVAG